MLAAVSGQRSPSIAEPIISISAASPRDGPGIGFANLGISFSTASPNPTPWRSDASCMIRWIFRRIFRTSIAVRRIRKARTDSLHRPDRR